MPGFPTFAEGQEVLAEDLNVISNGVRNFTEFCNAVCAADQTLTAGTTTLLEFANVRIGQPWIVGGTGGVTVPRDGVYQITLLVQTRDRNVTYGNGKLSLRVRFPNPDGGNIYRRREFIEGAGNASGGANGPGVWYVETVAFLYAGNLIRGDVGIPSGMQSATTNANVTALTVRQMA